MREGAARAQALEFIDRNPQGFEARIGERGRLDGRRVVVACHRAGILKDLLILTLGEATSALIR